MRIAFIGASEVSICTARALIKKDHEVVIIEASREKIDELSNEMDCSFLQGDGSHPDILREINPAQTDILFCLTNDDHANLIASLIGRSLGFKRVVTSIADAQFETICLELGLKDTIVPSRTISRYLEDMVGGSENIELSTIIKDEARFFTLIAKEEDAISPADLELPEEARAICYYREGKFMHAGANTKFAKGDEIIILTHSKNIPALQERWHAKSDSAEANDQQGTQKAGKGEKS